LTVLEQSYDVFSPHTEDPRGLGGVDDFRQAGRLGLLISTAAPDLKLQN
jgi:hypothetical protein